MAGNVVRSLFTKILFRSDPSGLKKVETNTRAVKRQMRAASRAAWSLKRDLRGIAIGFKAFAGAIIAGRAAKFLVSDFADSSDAAAKFSKATGVSTETYLGLTHAIRLSGGTVKDLQNGLQQAGKRARDAATGTKKTRDAFRELGVSVKNADGSLKNQDQILFDVADKMRGMKDGSSKTALAMELFGRSGARLIPMFNEGSEGIKKMIAEAKSLGIVLSKDQAKIAENYNDEMLRAKSVLLGVRNQIAVKLLPVITRNLRKFQLWARSGNNLKKTLDVLAVAIKVVAAAMAAFIAVSIGQKFKTIIGVVKKAVFWFRALGAAQAFAYAKMLLIAAAIALVVVALQDVYTFMKGGESYTGDFLKKFGLADKARAFVLGLRDAWRATLPYLKKAGLVIIDYMKGMHKIYAALWREFGPSLKELGKALVDLFIAIWPTIEQAAIMLRDSIMGLIEILSDLWHNTLLPAIDALRKSFDELWKVAGPILKDAWDLGKKLGNSLENLKPILPVLKDQFKNTFKVIAALINASITSLTLLIKAVTWVVEKLTAAYNLAKAALGLQKTGEGISSGVNAALAATKKTQPAQINANNSIGAISVTVQGTTSMTEAELSRSVSGAVGDAMQKMITDTAAGMRSLVPG